MCRCTDHIFVVLNKAKIMKFFWKTSEVAALPSSHKRRCPDLPLSFGTLELKMHSSKQQMTTVNIGVIDLCKVTHLKLGSCPELIKALVHWHGVNAHSMVTGVLTHQQIVQEFASKTNANFTMPMYQDCVAKLDGSGRSRGEWSGRSRGE